MDKILFRGFTVYTSWCWHKELNYSAIMWHGQENGKGVTPKMKLGLSRLAHWYWVNVSCIWDVLLSGEPDIVTCLKLILEKIVTVVDSIYSYKYAGLDLLLWELWSNQNYIMRKFHNLYFSHNITRMFKPRKMKWVRHAAWLGGMRDTCKMLAKKKNWRLNILRTSTKIF